MCNNIVPHHVPLYPGLWPQICWVCSATVSYGPEPHLHRHHCNAVPGRCPTNPTVGSRKQPVNPLLVMCWTLRDPATHNTTDSSHPIPLLRLLRTRRSNSAFSLSITPSPLLPCYLSSDPRSSWRTLPHLNLQPHFCVYLQYIVP